MFVGAVCSGTCQELEGWGGVWGLGLYIGGLVGLQYTETLPTVRI